MDSPFTRICRAGAIRRSAMAAIAVLVLAVGLGVWGWRLGWFGSDRTELESLKNVALGQLENIGDFQDFSTPIETFEEIARRAPDDPLGRRNLLICRLKQAKISDNNSVKSDIVDKLLIDVEALKRLQPSDAATHYLEGMVLQFSGETFQERVTPEFRNKIIAAYTRAAELAPDDPAPWYSLYVVLTNTTIADPDVPIGGPFAPELLDLLDNARKASPANLRVLIELAHQTAQSHDPRYRQAIEGLLAVTEGIPGMEERIVRGAQGQTGNLRADLLASAQAAEQGDWGPAGLLFSLESSLKKEMYTQNDLRYLDRDPLDFVVVEFARDRAAGSDAQPLSVEFAADAKGPLAELSGVLDVRCADFNLDRRLDLIVLREGRLETYARQDADPHWRLDGSMAIPPGYDRLLAVDLDDDTSIVPPKGEAGGDEVGAEKKKKPPASAPRDAEQYGHNPEACVDVDVDFVIYGAAGVLLVRNDPDGPGDNRRLAMMPQSERFSAIRNVLTVCPADLLHDGDLDLAIATAEGVSIWSNRGSGTFDSRKGDFEFTELPAADMTLNTVTGAASLAAVDLDADVDLDLVVTGENGQAAGMIENLRHGRFRWTPFALPGGTKIAARQALICDPNRDGMWDLLFAGKNGAELLTREYGRPQVVRFGKLQPVAESAVDSLTLLDFDNDGQRDFVAAGPKGARLWRGRLAGKFDEVEDALPADLVDVRACRASDLDSDGDTDLVLAAAGGLALLRNDGGNKNHWIDIWARAGSAGEQTRPKRINAHCLGAVLEARAGDHYEKQVIAEEVTHFGLGNRKRADAIRAIYTNGIPQNIVKPATVQDFCELQRLGGSCPYLYVWTGEKFEFFTDCLWAAPLGLQVEEGKYAGSKAWEYLSIPGERLQQRDGRYVLQMTEELWEVCYVDEMKLIAVDRPADVEIFSNEKVGPPEITQHKIHVARQPRTPRSARDQRGRNVLPKLRDRDRDFVKAFDVRHSQGSTEEHYIELDLGELDDPKQITLLLTGWMYPTNTSLNVATGEDPDVDAPRPPAVWVPDAKGEWRQTIPHMGFPGGKTKTIAVDLSQAFLTRDYRVRIVTSMEIYWDQAFFTVDEPRVEIEQTQLDLVRADLHYRGFSRRVLGKNHGPEWYDYQSVSAAAEWPPLDGDFTRYGDVSELLRATDDRLAIFGSGDEMTVEFKAPAEPPPAGWKRDFLLYNVGWDKDADLNTAYGQSVDPLPFQAMKAYPFSPGERYPNSAELQSYRRRYQTRQQHPSAFWRRLQWQVPTE